MKFYQFTLPDGMVAVEVSLENVSGTPMMYLAKGPVPAGTSDYISGASRDPYGNYGGACWTWWNNRHLNTSMISATPPQEWPANVIQMQLP
jgi:hypothetical protein